MSNYRRTDLDESKEYIIEKLTAGTSRAAICREFNCRYDTLRVRLKEWGVDHLKNQGSRGVQGIGSVPVVEYFNTHRYIKSHTLKLKLIEEGYREYKCEKCENTVWNNLPIPLELHHINGINHDNRLENLQVLCPNCHAQTPNHAGKGKRKQPKKPKKPRNRNNDITKKQTYVKTNNCLDCHVKIDRQAKRCKSCAQKALGRYKIDWPDTDTLVQMVESSSYLAVSRELWVSDNAIRKRIRDHS